MTSGLLLMTTDGLGAQRLTHPRYAVPRTYVVRVTGKPTAEVTRTLRRPTVIDGRRVEIEDLDTRSVAAGATDVELTLREGRYRIVRRICSVLDLRVERLKRLSYGPVRLGRLPIGKWRPLSGREQNAIAKLVDGNGH
jgi:pseudouridine synthase